MSKVIIEKSGPVKTIWMNRPEKRNALDSELMREMIEALQAPVAPEDRVVVIRGKGDVFCAGLDMAERRETIGGGNASGSASGTTAGSGVPSGAADDVPSSLTSSAADAAAPSAARPRAARG